MTSSHFRTGIWNLVFQYSNVFYAILSGIILVPLYLKFVDTGLYGAWLALFGIMQWFLIVDPGISTVSMQMTARALAERDASKLANLVFFTLVFHLILAAIVYVAFLASFGILIDFLNIAPEHHDSVRQAYHLAAVATAFSLISYGAVALCQGLQASLSIGLIFAFSNYTTLGLSVILLFSGCGLAAISVPLLIRAVLMLVLNHGYLVFLLKPHALFGNFRPNGSLGREILRHTGHNFLGKSSRAIVQNLDVVLVSRYLGGDAVVAYSLMKKSSEIAKILLERISAALMPILSNQTDRGTSGRLVGQVYFSVLYGGFVFLALNILFNEAFLGLWVGEGYYLGMTTNLLVSACAAVAILNTTALNLFVSLGDFKCSNLMTLAGNVCSIPLAYAGLKLGGIAGMLAGLLIAVLGITCLALHRRLFQLTQLRPAFMRETLLNTGAVALFALGFSVVPNGDIGIVGFCLSLMAAVGLYILLTGRFSTGAQVYWMLVQRVLDHRRPR